MTSAAAAPPSSRVRLQEILRLPATARQNALRQFLFADVAPLLDSRLDEAFELLEPIRALPSPDPIALAMYGDCCMRAKRYGDAELHLEHALRLAPGLEPAQLMLAELYLLRDEITGARRIAEAQQSCQNGLRRRWIEAAAACDADRGWTTRIDEQSPMDVQVDQALTGILSARTSVLGPCPEAIAHVIRQRSDGATRAPSMRIELAARLGLPRSYGSADEIDAARTRYSRAVDELHNDWPTARLAQLEPSLQQLSWSNFLLAYQGRDDRALQSRYGDWLALAARTLRPELCNPLTAPSNGRPRVGIVSGHWYGCTAGWYFESWIDALAELPIDLEVVALGAVDDGFTEALRRRIPGFVKVQGGADAIAEYLHARQFDMLIYPEIGMYTDLLPVAALRLAPIQWAAWGHPVTTGLPSIDRYVTCAEMEPGNASAHYREATFALPGIGTHYRPPSAPARATKAELGLPDCPAILIPQSIFKIHPDNDAVYRQLLDAHPTLRLMFVVVGQESESTRLRNRITRGLPAQTARRVSFLPFLPRPALLRVMSACDLMLDTLHWSGGNTSLDALRAGLPVVTSWGQFMRGRQSAAMLERIGLGSQLICAPDRLAAQAIELLHGDRLAQVRQQIHGQCDSLFDGRPALAVLREAVWAALQQSDVRNGLTSGSRNVG